MIAHCAYSVQSFMVTTTTWDTGTYPWKR